MKLGDTNINVRPHPILDKEYQFIRVFQKVLNRNDVVYNDSNDVYVSVVDDDPQQLQQQHSSSSSYITIVALNNPMKHNAINSTMWYEIGHVFYELNVRQDCRVIILLGIGKSFCSGIDITDRNFVSFPKPSNYNTSPDVARIASSLLLPKIKTMQECFTQLEQCTIPIIGIVHGYCFGAGIDLLCCTDIRICCTNTSTIFAVKEVYMGFAPDVGTLQRLPKICHNNQSHIHELCYTGRNFSYDEAMDIGLVSHRYCTPTLDECIKKAILEICVPIVLHSPIAIQNTKVSLLYSRDHTIQDGLNHIAVMNSYALQSNDVSMAFDKQQPRKSKKNQIDTSSKTNDAMIRSPYPDMLPHSKL
jgi:Delta3,5-Delta2,4-dienoyl-CoA isomerase